MQWATVSCSGRDSHPGTCPQKPLCALDKTERLRKCEGEPGCKTKGKGWVASPQQHEDYSCLRVTDTEILKNKVAGGGEDDLQLLGQQSLQIFKHSSTYLHLPANNEASEIQDILNGSFFCEACFKDSSHCTRIPHSQQLSLTEKVAIPCRVPPKAQLTWVLLYPWL